MYGFSDNVMPSVFNYGKNKIITWNNEPHIDKDGNAAGYRYECLELHYEATDVEIKAALKARGLTVKQINEILKDRQDVKPSAE